jgi:hypothetical protein
VPKAVPGKAVPSNAVEPVGFLAAHVVLTLVARLQMLAVLQPLPLLISTVMMATMKRHPNASVYSLAQQTGWMPAMPV